MYLHVNGREVVLLCSVLHQAESHICLETGMRWGSVYSDCMSSSRCLYDFQVTKRDSEGRKLLFVFWSHCYFPRLSKRAVREGF